ncbi:MAG: alpha/beta hydrolase [Ruminococcaceae bacterium]|jgi:acetyl esterase/lipase|nr:alpha/beta hydrolase [Oscillospiraceae bacterium]
MQVVKFKANGAPVTLYLHEDHDRLAAHKTRPALIICAGGCYRWLSPREKDPAALAFAAMGYQTLLLEYSTGERASALRPLHELAETVRIVRERAKEWHIEPQHVGVLGFSAGGHLAASLGVLWHELGLGEACRPDALVLSYPVITTGEFAHRESAELVTGGDPALRAMLSLENHVTAHMPPTFVWHCTGDESVPVENTLLLTTAMQRMGVPYECHLFSGGAHGISVCTQEVETPNAACAAWLGLCRTWLNDRFQFTP